MNLIIVDLGSLGMLRLVRVAMNVTPRAYWEGYLHRGIPTAWGPIWWSTSPASAGLSLPAYMVLN